MANSTIKVVYIAGPSRSGSTFLSSILGEMDGFFNAGELIDFFEWGLVTDGACSCGVPFSECPVWMDIVRVAFGAPDSVDAAQMVRMRDRMARSHHVLAHLMARCARKRLASRLGAYGTNLQKLYDGIQQSTACRVILDASKNAGYAYLLGLIPGIDLYLLHVVRDPRATTYSWQRKKKGLRKDPPWMVALTWDSRNVATELLGRHDASRYFRLRYEDFVQNPVRSAQRVLRAIGEEPHSLPFVGDHEVELGESHSLYGNPNRFQKGRLKVQLDNEWMERIKPLHRWIATILTWPLMIRYGYPLTLPRPSPGPAVR